MVDFFHEKDPRKIASTFYSLSLFGMLWLGLLVAHMLHSNFSSFFQGIVHLLLLFFSFFVEVYFILLYYKYLKLIIRPIGSEEG